MLKILNNKDVFSTKNENIIIPCNMTWKHSSKSILNHLKCRFPNVYEKYVKMIEKREPIDKDNVLDLPIIRIGKVFSVKSLSSDSESKKNIYFVCVKKNATDLANPNILGLCLLNLLSALEKDHVIDISTVAIGTGSGKLKLSSTMFFYEKLAEKYNVTIYTNGNKSN